MSEQEEETKCQYCEGDGECDIQAQREVYNKPPKLREDCEAFQPKSKFAKKLFNYFIEVF